MTSIDKEHPAYRGQAPYSPAHLRFYDPVVVKFSNRFVWRCSARRLMDLYDKHVSARHLDIGPGTGYFLDHCRFPVARPEITLLDLNPSPLAYVSERIARYGPRTHRADLLEPFDLGSEGFDSIGLNYVLHCLPGSIPEKSRVFGHVAANLATGGVLFGSTILAHGVTQTAASRMLIRAYNRAGSFGNAEDSLVDLERALSAEFGAYTVETRGTVALFTARKV